MEFRLAMRAEINKKMKRAEINIDRMNQGLKKISLGEWATIDEQETGVKYGTTGFASIDNRHIENLMEVGPEELPGSEKAAPPAPVKLSRTQKQRIAKGKKKARAAMELGHQR
jgi:hypothetical protein